MPSYRQVSTAVIALLASLLLSAGARAQSTLLSMRYGEHEGHTRVVLDLDSAVRIRNFTLADPDRLVVDIPQTRRVGELPRHFDDDPLVRAVRYGERDGGQTLRLVFDTAGEVLVHTRYLKAMAERNHRVVLDIEPLRAPGTAPRRAQRKRPLDPPQRSPNVVVAIDAGHGGKDPGASGARNSREKDIVLRMALRLKRLLDEVPGVQGVLTREDDSFLKLGERLRRIRAAKPDLMLSLHADAFNDPSAAGSSVYVLSTKGASSAAAKFLATSENRLAGLDMATQSDELKRTILDLSQGASRELASEAGERLLAHIARVNKLHKETVEYAGFVVLKAPDVPSILVEMAFISNPDEEAQLLSPNYQDRFASALRDGIVEYFIENAPYGTDFYRQYRDGRKMAAVD